MRYSPVMHQWIGAIYPNVKRNSVAASESEEIETSDRKVAL